MIARIMQCDNCRASTAVGARPASSGSEARRGDHAGSIRRVKIARYRRASATSRTSLISADLCGGCRNPATVAIIHDRRMVALAPYGYVEVAL